jgi:O-antigen/teichoic acid export membrane protein
MSHRRILNGAAANIYGQIVTIGTQLLGVPILIAGWGLGGFGLWTLVSAVPIMLISLDFGYSAAAAGMMSRAIAREDEFDALVSLQSAALVIFGIVAALLGMAVSTQFLPGGGQTHAFAGLAAEDVATAVHMLPFMLAYIAISLVSGLVNAVYRVNGHYVTGVMIFETGRLIEQMLIMACAFSGGSLVMASILMVGSRLTFTMLSTLRMLHVTPWVRLSLSHASRERLRQLFRPAMGAMFIPLCILAGVQGVTFAVGLFLSPAIAGGFATIRVLYRMVVQIVGTLTRATVPDFAIVYAKGDIETQRKIARFTVVALFLGAATGTGGVLLLGPTFIHSWTHGHVQIPYLIYIILASHAFFGCLWNGLSNLLAGLNLHPRYVPQLILWNLLGIGSIFFLIDSGGLPVAALSLAFIDICSFASVWRIWRTVATSPPHSPAKLSPVSL